MIKDEFPIFSKHKNLVYLDNAATTQKPQRVINRIKKFYEEENSNIHRGIYPLSEKATALYEDSRKIVASFIGSSSEEIIFTSGTTESINLLAQSILPLLKGRKEIVLTEVEHHSNLLPWKELAKKHGLVIKYIPIKDFLLNYEKAKKMITEKTGLVAITHMSNTLGTKNHLQAFITYAKDQGVLTFVDAAQSVSHDFLNVRTLQCDFLAFSGHKMYGPLGIGVLFGKKHLLDQLSPSKTGGGMVNLVGEKNIYKEGPQKFEAGTPNIVGAIGLATAAEWLEEQRKKGGDLLLLELSQYLLEQLQKVRGIIVYLPKESQELGYNKNIISFNLEGIHSHDVADILGRENICIRAGHHCTQPLMKKLGVNTTCRVSLALYNTKDDIEKFIEGLKKVQEVFS